MSGWVALLRGVNVGGITIRNAELREVFGGLGFSDVRTVLASGNVVFGAASGEERGVLKARIERGLRERFGYDAWIVLITTDELRAAIDAFPFDAADAGRQPWVLFCVDAGTRDELVSIAETLDPGTDPVAAGPGVVYWHPAKGQTTDTPFAKVVARNVYRSRTTNRNLRTLDKIIG